MVFQNYALFPHLSVFDNIAYGLRREGGTRQEIRARVSEALAWVREDRPPDEREHKDTLGLAAYAIKLDALATTVTPAAASHSSSGKRTAPGA